MTKPKTNKVKISCLNGKPMLVTKNYVEGIKTQMIRDIKAKRIENPKVAEFYFYGIANFTYIKESKSTVLSITYGDALSALNVDKKGCVYVEVPFRTRPSRKKVSVIL